MDELKEEIIKLIQDAQDERLLQAVAAYIKVLLTKDYGFGGPAQF